MECKRARPSHLCGAPELFARSYPVHLPLPHGTTDFVLEERPGKCDLFAEDKVIIPIHVSSVHWCLCCCFMQERRVGWALGMASAPVSCSTAVDILRSTTLYK